MTDELEFIVIQTSLSSGAALYIYKIEGGELKPFLMSNFIGLPYRWLNVAAIDDLDNDGNVEIAWIQPPKFPCLCSIISRTAR